MALKYEEFYVNNLKNDWEGAKVSPTTVDSILRMFEEWSQDAASASVSGQSASDALWTMIKVMRDHGFEAFGPDADGVQWLKEALDELSMYQAADALKKENQTIVMQPPSELSVFEDILVYTQEGQTWQSARKMAAREREMHGPNTRVFYHEHQPGEPCSGKCKEIPDVMEVPS